MKLPLNGTKTHPLTNHAIGVLKRLSVGPINAYEVNPGVRDRFVREALAECRHIPSRSFATYHITEAGRKRLAELE